MACITTSLTAMYTAFAFTNDEHEKDKMYNFWMWILVPIAATAMSISFALKPGRRDMLYKFFCASNS
ncbi:hypothetical protein TrLO_g14873 [Triparma laevis f. longispina]|uniref:Uncharacterized protein n=1 Tax=Triparma laevis f. longispina TaxID=1714387 RepID=A0A9W7FSZ5_9STRA|nr:hypothetical protein TrLO_g14873 [Triparma laevis f. longispina]